MAKKKRPKDTSRPRGPEPKEPESTDATLAADAEGADAPEDVEREEASAKEPVEQAIGESIAEEDEADKRAGIEQLVEGEAPAEKAAAPHPTGAAWGEPIARFERKWTWFEAQLITYVLVSQILVLVAWVFLTGLSSPVSSGNAAGTVFRAIAGALVLGLAAHVIARRKKMDDKLSGTILRLVAIVIGLALAPLWRKVGVEYFDNVKGWLQEGSTLTLVGGLRGLATRLTLWLALLGASLATAAGKHIHIDVVFRFLPKKARLYGGITSFVATAAVCFSAAWGFFDHIAIESYGAKADATAGAKIERAFHEFSVHAFLTRKQIGLDVRTLPHVVAGQRYDRWMQPAAWNAWLKDGGWEDHFGPDALTSLTVPEEGGVAHPPLVIAPDGSNTRGMLVDDLALVFPFGLIAIGLRFLLRALLALSGHATLDPEAAHQDDDEKKTVAAKGAA